MSPPIVLFAERRLTHYRVPLLERLRADLERRGVRLRFVHGQPTDAEAERRDSGEIRWAEQVRNRYWQVGSTALCWQPLPPNARDADLVIISQENSLISNHRILLGSGRSRYRLAFFGHGANLQSRRPDGLSERFKRWTTRKVDWWFAYTKKSADLVAAAGFPAERITDLENAVDTAGLRTELSSLGDCELVSFRRQLGLDDGRVGLYVGSLYADKRLDLLIEAADRLHTRDPAFRLLIAGDGPLRDQVTRACESRSWCRWVGFRAGRDKAMLLALADVLLNPGIVGLTVLDSFAAGVPMVTTDLRQHGPEIAYVRQHENGVLSQNSVEHFVEAVSRVLHDQDYRARLVAGCRTASAHYTIENMATRFADGAVRCLTFPRKSG